MLICKPATHIQMLISSNCSADNNAIMNEQFCHIDIRFILFGHLSNRKINDMKETGFLNRKASPSCDVSPQSVTCGSAALCPVDQKPVPWLVNTLQKEYL